MKGKGLSVFCTAPKGSVGVKETSKALSAAASACPPCSRAKAIEKSSIIYFFLDVFKYD
jgi:hypothetical protein